MIKELKLHPTQYDVWEDNHRFKVVCGGRRWGKGILALVSCISEASKKNDAIVAIVGPTFQQVKDIYWRDPQKIPSLIPPEAISKKNDSELFLQLVNGSYLYLRGSDRPDLLRGLRYDFVVLDEFSSMKESVWEEVIQPTLLDSGGSALFISTPKGYNHFYDLWIKGQAQDAEWRSWRFTSYDNPYLEREYIEQMKKDMDEDTFAQEILAEFKKFTGLVYKDFSREKHVIEPSELQANWTYFRGIDFGFANPTAVIFAAVTDKGELIVWDEIYRAGLQTPDLAQLIKQKSEGKTFVNTIADSAQMADIEELRRYGLMVNPVSKTSGSREEDWTTHKIRKVSEKLRNGTLKIYKNCQNLVFEFENYQYHEVRDKGHVKEVPQKINDHLLDALSYLICSLPEKITPTLENQQITDFINQLPKENYFSRDGFY